MSTTISRNQFNDLAALAGDFADCNAKQFVDLAAVISVIADRPTTEQIRDGLKELVSRVTDLATWQRTMADRFRGMPDDAEKDAAELRPTFDVRAN